MTFPRLWSNQEWMLRPRSSTGSSPRSNPAFTSKPQVLVLSSRSPDAMMYGHIAVLPVYMNICYLFLHCKLKTPPTSIRSLVEPWTQEANTGRMWWTVWPYWFRDFRHGGAKALLSIVIFITVSWNDANLGIVQPNYVNRQAWRRVMSRILYSVGMWAFWKEPRTPSWETKHSQNNFKKSRSHWQLWERWWRKRR